MRIEDRVACATCKAHRDRSRSVMCAVCHDLECVPVMPTPGDIDALLLEAHTNGQITRLLEIRRQITRAAAARPLEERRH